MKRTTKLRLEKKDRARTEMLRKHCFYKFLSIKDKTLEDALVILTKYRGAIAAQLRRLKELAKEAGWETDDRSGLETYGYKDEESIMYELLHISDRHSAEFRLQWVLDLIDGKTKQ